MHACPAAAGGSLIASAGPGLAAIELGPAKKQVDTDELQKTKQMVSFTCEFT